VFIHAWLLLFFYYFIIILIFAFHPQNFSNSSSRSFIKPSAVFATLHIPSIPLQLRSSCQSSSPASIGKSYSGLCSPALDFIHFTDFTARYRILTFSVVFRFLPEDPIRVKQAVEVLVLCFYCNCVYVHQPCKLFIVFGLITCPFFYKHTKPDCGIKIKHLLIITTVLFAL